MKEELKKIILILILIIVQKCINAQEKLLINDNKLFTNNYIIYTFNKKKSFWLDEKIKLCAQKTFCLTFNSFLQANNYTKNLPFFCEKELQLNKYLLIPFKFRLGSMEYVNKLEGKK